MNPQKEYSKAQYLYTPLFCEENIWQLLQSFLVINESVANETKHLNTATDKMWALIITNPGQKIALLNQQAAAINQPVIWDYHVIMLAEINYQYLIFDFDTRLPFVTPLQEYLQHTFIPPDKLPQEFTLYLRKVPAQSYLDKFYSDRSHMQNQIDTSEFPPWPVINADKAHCITLADYLKTEQKLDDKSQVHKVSSLEALELWLTDH